MTKINGFQRFCSIIIAIFITCLTIYAAEAQADTSVNEQPGKLTLLADTPVYNGASTNDGPVGIISAFQSVQVVKTSNGLPESPNQLENNRYLVKTWLGEKWLQNGPAVIKEKYYAVRMDVTLKDIEDIYDFPGDNERTVGTLSPQTVRVLGELYTCSDETLGSVQPESERCQPWYRVVTYLGEKWIHPARAIEHYEDNEAVAHLTASEANYRDKFRSSGMKEFEPLFTKLSLEPVSLLTENDIERLEVRRLYRHRDMLNYDEIEALKNALFNEVGGSFPLSITTFTISHQADVEGNIMSIDHSRKRILVINYNKRTGLINPTPEASWFSVAGDSNIHRKGQDSKLRFDDLTIGQTVEVWKARFSSMSYPGQTTAYEIAIAGDNKPSEEGIPLSTILDFDVSRIDKIELQFKQGKRITIQEPDIIQALSERLQRIRLQPADQYQGQDEDSYTMTLYQGDRKASYSSDLLLLMLSYKQTPLTIELDEFIRKLSPKNKLPANNR
ncbi:hypothetical protein [Paenibacillus sp. OAS669]|uniref:hypothetical protein n=1 Tax=Paenibacillus sp. OAS669 TaxID=2663821 RepID=UPI00178A7AA9|nr:hypothetical protein [Paenibacillus sp. OAS669]MBE1442447.1 hypothetical protein [Paenibacillus sp. OAS669]